MLCFSFLIVLDFFALMPPHFRISQKKLLVCEVYEAGVEHRHGMERLSMWGRGEKGVQKETVSFSNSVATEAFFVH